jgi:hypothetical protein
MQFVIQIAIPVNDNGWEGTQFLPTIQMSAPCKVDAIARVATIISFMPEGTTYTIAAI